MYLDDALRLIGEPPETREAFPLELRLKDLTPDRRLVRLDPDSVSAYCGYCGLEAEVRAALLDLAAETVCSEALSTAAEGVFRAVFLERQRVDSRWPSFGIAPGRERADLFYLLIALQFVPLVRELHRRTGVPENVTRQTCSVLNSIACAHRFFTGRVGIAQPNTSNQMLWLRYYLSEERHYLHIGRFGYMTVPNELPCAVYRRKNGGHEHLVYAQKGLHFDRYGYAVLSVPDSAEETDFVSDLWIESGVLHGNRVSPNGCTEKDISELDLNGYELCLSPGDPVLDMHIPAGGGMTPDAADESFRAAKHWYLSRPGETAKPRAVVCNSWIFNPNLPSFLSAESNLVKLLRRVHPVPVPSSDSAGLWFLFHQTGRFDPASAMRRTGLQRAVLDYLAQGGRWRSGGMYLLMDEIDDWNGGAAC